MNYIQAALLGLIQGLGEFLPISSSGHLQFATFVLGLESDPAAYLLLTILLHVGTLIPIIIVFWKDWLEMLLHPVRQKKLWGMLILASIPALAAHVLGLDEPFETGWFLGCSFLLTAALLLISEWISSRRRSARTKPGWLDALVMGCFQAFALLPGVSRSGSTITGGLVRGLDRKTAAKFSFMMSAPAIGGSLLLEGVSALRDGTFASFQAGPMILGILVAAVTGYLAIRFMLELINRISLGWFALYVALIGLAFLLLQLTGNPLVPAFTPAAVPLA